MAKLSALISSPAGSWCLLSICLSLISSFMAHPSHSRGTSGEKQAANLSICLDVSEHLMRQIDDSLHHFQATFNCTMGHIYPINPKNEEKIKMACMGGKSSKPGYCMSEANDVDQASCMDTIYTILKNYEVEIKTFNSPKLLDIVNRMLKALKTDHKMTKQPASIQQPLKKFYANDMNQCQNLLILQQLSQTIHRILNYRKSLEI